MGGVPLIERLCLDTERWLNAKALYAKFLCPDTNIARKGDITPKNAEHKIYYFKTDHLVFGF
jgi:hypothetical protein